MHDERQEILNRLSAGEITAEEAEKSLKTLQGKRQRRWSALDWLASLFGARAKVEEHHDWTLDGTDVALIKAQTENGSISLQGSDRDQVTAHAWKRVRAPSETAAEAFAEQVQIHVERQGDEIHIYKEHPKPPTGISVSVGYEISSPRDVDANLHTTNGAIRIHQVDGAVEAVTTNGAVELHGGAGEVKLRTSNGAIHLQDTTGQVHADTSNGKIAAHVDRLEAGAFSTSNGAIDIQIRQGNAPVTAKTSNGAILVTLPTGFSGQLDARTTNGRVHAELPLSVTREGQSRLEGQIGEGGETTVKLRTLNGSIRIKTQP